MIRLECDYACGAHPAVLDKLVATNGKLHVKLLDLLGVSELRA